MNSPQSRVILNLSLASIRPAFDLRDGESKIVIANVRISKCSSWCSDDCLSPRRPFGAGRRFAQPARRFMRSNA